jgi:hypothetical protein
MQGPAIALDEESSSDRVSEMVWNREHESTSSGYQQRGAGESVLT